MILSVPYIPTVSGVECCAGADHQQVQPACGPAPVHVKSEKQVELQRNLLPCTFLLSRRAMFSSQVDTIGTVGSVIKSINPKDYLCFSIESGTN